MPLFDNYVVEELLGTGGMGQVYRVRNTITDALFAVKRALASSSQHRQQLMTELLTWIDLPAHPNVAACRFFRSVGDEVVIFAEFVDGGTLSDRLLDWRAHRDSVSISSILDIAIQLAWGLHVVHSWGVTHLDVKPANVLMTTSGLPKLNDFGLARATRGRRSSGPNSAHGTGGGFLTPEYASPEQLRGEGGPASDVFSWAVTVLELFIGERVWQYGPAAADVLAEASADGLDGSSVPGSLPMPTQVRALLMGCLAVEPESRPTMYEATKCLTDVFLACVARPYARSLIDVPPRSVAIQSRWTGASQVIRPLLACVSLPGIRLPNIPDAASERARAVADLATCDDVLFHASAVYARPAEDLPATTALLEVILYKAALHRELDDLGGAERAYEEAMWLAQPLAQVVDPGTRLSLVRALIGRADTLRTRGHGKQAEATYVEAERRIGTLGNVARYELGMCAFGRGQVRLAADDGFGAIGHLGRAAVALQGAHASGSRQPASLLVDVLLATAEAHLALDDVNEALSWSSDALLSLERLVRAGSSELTGKLAQAHMRHADILERRGDEHGALGQCNAAIHLLRPLVQQGAERFLADLAQAYLRSATLLGDQEATALANSAILLIEQFVAGGGRDALAPTLANAYMVRAAQSDRRGDKEGAIGWRSKAISLWERLLSARGPEFLIPLAEAKLARWLLMRDTRSSGLRDECSEVLALLDQVIDAHKMYALNVVRVEVRAMMFGRRA